MTLDELLAQARIVAGDGHCRACESGGPSLALDLLDLLGEAAPCGWPEPDVKGPRSIWWESLGCLLTSDEARAIAAMLLRAADRAEVR